jgi:hypothetical protein
MNTNAIIYVLVAFDAVIGISSALSGDFWRMGYWFAAGFLSICTIYMK